MVEWHDKVTPEMVVVALEEVRLVLLEEDQEVTLTVNQVVDLVNLCLRGELP